MRATGRHPSRWVISVGSERRATSFSSSWARVGRSQARTASTIARMATAVSAISPPSTGMRPTSSDMPSDWRFSIIALRSARRASR